MADCSPQRHAERAAAERSGSRGRRCAWREYHHLRHGGEPRHAENDHCRLPARDPDQELGERDDRELAERAAGVDDAGRHRAPPLGDPAINCGDEHRRADRAGAGSGRHAAVHHGKIGSIRYRPTGIDQSARRVHGRKTDSIHGEIDPYFLGARVLTTSCHLADRIH
jgi:hypothetical protein